MTYQAELSGRIGGEAHGVPAILHGPPGDLSLELAAACSGRRGNLYLEMRKINSGIAEQYR